MEYYFQEQTKHARCSVPACMSACIAVRLTACQQSARRLPCPVSIWREVGSFRSAAWGDALCPGRLICCSAVGLLTCPPSCSCRAGEGGSAPAKVVGNTDPLANPEGNPRLPLPPLPDMNIRKIRLGSSRTIDLQLLSATNSAFLRCTQTEKNPHGVLAGRRTLARLTLPERLLRQPPWVLMPIYRRMRCRAKAWMSDFGTVDKRQPSLLR